MLKYFFAYKIYYKENSEDLIKSWFFYNQLSYRCEKRKIQILFTLKNSTKYIQLFIVFSKSLIQDFIIFNNKVWVAADQGKAGSQ